MAKLHCYSTAPRGPSSRGRLAVVALVGLLTGAAVWGLGQRELPSGETFRATAAVSIPDQAGLSAETIQRTVLADSFLQDAWGTSAATLRPNLRVDSQQLPSGQWRTALTCTASDRDQTLQHANRLAEHLASVVRANAPSIATTPSGSTEIEAAQAERQAARAQLDRFVAEHFARLQQRAQRLEQAVTSTPLPNSVTAEPPRSTDASLVENPQWVEVNNRIAQMEQDRAGLLQTRTPEHPSVRDLESELARLNQQLQALARRIPASELPAGQRPMREAVVPPPVAAAPPIDLQPIAQDDRAAAAHYDQLRQIDQRAEEHVQQVAEAQRQSLPPAGPSLALVEPAQRCEPMPGSPAGRPLLLVALVAAVAMASGVGMMTLGLAEPPLLTVADAQAALPVPVVGVVSVSGAEALAARRSPRLARVAWLGSGLLVIVACGGLLATYFRA